MAGLYIHVPFCKTRCTYCSFYSTTGGTVARGQYVKRLCEEMTMRPSAESLSTVYLGGGTPSQLSADEVRCIFAAIRENYALQPSVEITIEANPDDVTEELVAAWVAVGVNRVSLGVQSFVDAELSTIRRRHDAQQAKRAVQLIYESGIRNISVDLIYGLPGQTLESFGDSVRQALALPITHLSSYALSIEPGSAMAREGVEESDEELTRKMYELLMDSTVAAGMEHYEISNFALPGYHSRHNSSYWNGSPYIGLGPGAHGFDGVRLRYHYLADWRVEEENLSDDELYDECVFTHLRTSQGLDIDELPQVRRDYLLRMARPHINSGRLLMEKGCLRLAKSAIYISDSVISDLMAE